MPSERETCRFFLSIAVSFRNYMVSRDGSHFFILLFDQLHIVFVFLALSIYVNRDERDDYCPEGALGSWSRLLLICPPSSQRPTLDSIVIAYDQDVASTTPKVLNVDCGLRGGIALHGQ